ncbi:hypothetical protein OAO18_06485 [Francisellaceae bacterium]|nr:hypothetical protein [Francisellaceae bacterium]
MTKNKISKYTSISIIFLISYWLISCILVSYHSEQLEQSQLSYLANNAHYHSVAYLYEKSNIQNA